MWTLRDFVRTTSYHPFLYEKDHFTNHVLSLAEDVTWFYV